MDLGPLTMDLGKVCPSLTFVETCFLQCPNCDNDCDHNNDDEMEEYFSSDMEALEGILQTDQSWDEPDCIFVFFVFVLFGFCVFYIFL